MIYKLPRYTLLPLFLLLAFSACAVSRSGEGSSNRNLLTSEEIQQAGGQRTAYEVIRNLRPHWLRKRGRQSIYHEGDIVIYLDDMRYGGPEALREINVTSVQSIQFLSATQASSRFGLDHGHGAIIVETM